MSRHRHVSVPHPVAPCPPPHSPLGREPTRPSALGFSARARRGSRARPSAPGFLAGISAHPPTPTLRGLWLLVLVSWVSGRVSSPRLQLLLPAGRPECASVTPVSPERPPRLPLLTGPPHQVSTGPPALSRPASDSHGCPCRQPPVILPRGASCRDASLRRPQALSPSRVPAAHSTSRPPAP